MGTEDNRRLRDLWPLGWIRAPWSPRVVKAHPAGLLLSPQTPTWRSIQLMLQASRPGLLRLLLLLHPGNHRWSWETNGISTEKLRTGPQLRASQQKGGEAIQVSPPCRGGHHRRGFFASRRDAPPCFSSRLQRLSRAALVGQPGRRALLRAARPTLLHLQPVPPGAAHPGL